MSHDLIHPPADRTPIGLRDALCARGFIPNSHEWQRGGLIFARRGRWLVLKDYESGPGELALTGGMGRRSLWKEVRNGAPPHLSFELPSWAVSEQVEEDPLDEAGPAPFPKLLDWALDGRRDRLPVGRRPPRAELVRSWLGRGALTVQARGCVRQGELILEPDRWAIRIPILTQVSPELSEPRRRALDELAEEAQRHWAMVRVGVPDSPSPPSLLAEVDFTGAPHSELLFSAGLAALRHVVAWLAETASAIGDPGIVIHSLAPCSDNNTQHTERIEP